MEKYILLKSLENGGDISFKAGLNVGWKISSKTNDDAIVQIKKSLSIRSDKFAKILNSKPSQPLFIDFNGSTSPSIGTSSNICDDENVQPQSNNEGTSNRLLNGMDNLTPPSIASHISAMNVNSRTPQNHHVLARLQRDLDSPSAATRIRAMKALKSPANGPYNQFDVPHEEQDIITEEERRDLVPRTIQDVMKDVIVYVEVRFGDENRTASIKGKMAELGATVNDNFNKNTTHLIFGNGTQSTYNKAKQLNIPIVSILWIEACKKQLRLVDPLKYPIHNIDQYENPELYKKVKVKKFFQTENELKFKKTKKVTPSTLPKLKSIKIPKKAKDNLTSMFNDFHKRQANNSNGIDYLSENFNVADLFNDSTTTGTVRKEGSTKRALFPDSVETNATQISRGKAKSLSPSSKLLEEANSSKVSARPPQVPKNNSPAIFKTPVNRKTEQSSNSLVRVTRRSLALSSPSLDITPLQRNRHVMPEEITEITDCNVNQTKNVSEAMEITPSVASPPRVISSRRTMFTSSAMDVTEPVPTVNSARKRNSIIPAKFKDFEVNTKKYLVKNLTNSNNSQSEKSNRRRTVLASSSLAVSPFTKEDEGLKELPNRRQKLFELNQTSSNTVDDSTPIEVMVSPEPSSNRRETIFAPNEASSPIVVNRAATRDVSNLHRSLFKPNNATVTSVISAETLNETKNSTSSKRRRTLLSPEPTTPGPSVESNLTKVDEIQKSASKRRTALPLSNKASTSLVVSTLDEIVVDTPTNRRRTVLTSSHAVSGGSSVTSALSKPNGITKATNRRRTCFTTSHTNRSPSQDKLNNDLGFGARTDVQIPPTGVTERNKSLSGDYLTPQRHTLFDEFSQTITFSSTNKRHTVEDITTHIIQQRLKNINELARMNRSASESDVNIDNIGKSISERIASPHLLALENGGIKKTATVNEEPPAPKRRKLFDPTAYDEQVVMKSTDFSDNNNKTSASASNGSVAPKKNIKSRIPLDKRFNNRRSTMDFQKGAPKPAQVYANTMKTNSPMNYLAYTNMNRDQVNDIDKAITSLGKFIVESNVTKRTTHLVTCDSKRTQKCLRAIIRGLWIVHFDWVTASLQAGIWLHEEPFENRSFSNAVSMCRAEAQAFGSKYKIEIFGHLDPVYISTKCKCPDLTELYKMCGGRVTNNRTTAKYIVTDKFKKDVNQICLRSDWILDSITAANCKNPLNYILKLVPL